MDPIERQSLTGKFLSPHPDLSLPRPADRLMSINKSKYVGEKRVWYKATK